MRIQKHHPTGTNRTEPPSNVRATLAVPVRAPANGDQSLPLEDGEAVRLDFLREGVSEQTQRELLHETLVEPARKSGYARNTGKKLSLRKNIQYLCGTIRAAFLNPFFKEPCGM
jgi:hypothetical protein